MSTLWIISVPCGRSEADPGGRSEAEKDYICLYLKLKGAASRSFKANYTMGIVGKNEDTDVEGEWTGESFKNDWGKVVLLERSDFLDLNLGYLVDGELMAS